MPRSCRNQGTEARIVARRFLLDQSSR
ncbi:hypothetical protein DSM3645_03943 [Blastopirellula marina DSM 3645]|uniref:Uncharacterized protein n=1 Tax=Blastopirellula marina DSM 3645 TaxID=314230 RepID=A3ZV60_9BACT|nr:hypothetical protein DSM3645_03943 [Blastopirellula marina DSM 3645]